MSKPKKTAAKQAAAPTEVSIKEKPTVAEWMAQQDATEAATTKATKKAKAPAKPKTKANTVDEIMPKARANEDLVVFAIRCTPEERDLLHEAAGPARASRFVRAVALAAARHDVAALQAIMLETQKGATAS